MDNETRSMRLSSLAKEIKSHYRDVRVKWARELYSESHQCTSMKLATGITEPRKETHSTDREKASMKVDTTEIELQYLSPLGLASARVLAKERNNKCLQGASTTFEQA